MFFVVFVLSFVGGLILPSEKATSFHPSLHEGASILSLWQGHLSLTLEHVLLEVALVGGPIWKFIKSLSMFRAIQKISSVLCAIFPFLFPNSIGEIVQPFSSIGIIFSLINKCAFSLGYIVSNLTFVVTALAEDIPSISMRESMSEGAVVIGPIFEEQFTNTMWLVVLPFSPVDGL